MTSKGETNRKWTSSPKYRSNYDRIFAKVCDYSCPQYNGLQDCLLHLDAVTTGSNVHHLAMYKTLCTLRDCDNCEERLTIVRQYIARRSIGPDSVGTPPVEVCPTISHADAIKRGPASSIDKISISDIGRY